MAVLCPANAGVAAITSEGDVFFNADVAIVGWESDGALTVTPPDVLEVESLTVAYEQGVVGSLLVDGGAVRVGYDSLIGYEGIGDLTVTAGGVFQQRSGDAVIGYGQGRLTVTGPGSLADFGGESDLVELYVGGGGPSRDSPGNPRGDVVVSDGGELRTTGATFGDGGSASVLVTGAGSRWFYSDETRLRNATLTVSDGAQLLATATDRRPSSFGFGEGAVGWIDGAGSLVTAEEISLDGDAVVRVTGGADVSTSATHLAPGGPFSSGRLELDGLGTTWTTGDLTLGGRDGLTEVSITDGASLVFSPSSSQSGGLLIAGESGSTAIVTIDGPASRLLATGNDGAALTVVGDRGRGALRVLNGALHKSYATSIGPAQSEEGEGDVVVSGRDSLWDVEQGLYVSRGALTVSDGGAVRLPYPSEIRQEGEIVLDGGTLLGRDGNSELRNGGRLGGDGVIEAAVVNENLGEYAAVLGVGPDQRLEIDRLENYGRVVVDRGELVVGDFEIYETGELDIDGGELEFTELYTTGTIDLRDATLRGDANSSTSNLVLSDGEIRFLGGESRVDAPIVGRGGRVVVTGDSDVTMTESVSGGFLADEGSTLRFLDDFVGNVIGGASVLFHGDVTAPLTTTDSLFDADIDFAVTAALEVGFWVNASSPLLSEGDIDLGGELLLEVQEGALAPGVVEVAVVEAASLTDEFDFVPELGEYVGPSTRFLGIEYTATSAIVTLEQLAMGDVNADGFVDDADIGLWNDGYGGVGAADSNGDGVVNALDYLVIRETMTDGGGDNPIPEPATIGLVAIAALWRRRHGDRFSAA